DCPINCTIRNCEAFGCGKAATTASAGASGIGMGTGYCEQENMIIENCYCEGNMKFGIFFEHQGRFNPSYYPAQKLGRMLIVNCSARNNYIDLGCELGVDVVYRCCDVYADSTANTKLGFNHHTVRCRFEYMNVQSRFTDVTDSTIYYYDAVYWAVNKGVTTGVGNNEFGINAKCTVGQAITFLYRLAGQPGALKLVNSAERVYYEDSLEWAVAKGIVASGVDVNATCTRETFIEMMWRYSGSPHVEGQYGDAINWALESGIMNTVMDSDILRRDAVTILYRYFSPFDKYTSDDAVGLLRHLLFPEDYPLMFRSGDFDKNGFTTSDDAVYLLRHVLFPEDYPID
ncbi:MAG: S-layer homology domain-containing protein, partial [Clostridia bacterium]|nr:S-layer homology domain-containing protein [Clostridia bacterium]